MSTPRPATMAGRGPDLRDRVQYRPTAETDIPAMHRVFVTAEGELLARHGFLWPEPPPVDRVAPSHRHLLALDADRAHVAVVDGEVVGYGTAFVRGDTWFLASLFIDPGFQGLGIGARLIELAAVDAPSRRLTITDSIQPVSNALYTRFGMLPTTPILTFTGTPRSAGRSDLVPSAPDPEALAVLDAAAYAFDRAVDHAFWAGQASGTVWSRDGRPVAYSYRWPNGRIGPVAGIDGSTAGHALAAELARVESAFVQIPGTSRGLVRAALAAGLRLDAPAGLLLTSDEAPAPTSLAISSYGLY